MDTLIFKVVGIVPETKEASTLLLEPAGGGSFGPSVAEGLLQARQDEPAEPFSYEAGQFLTFLISLHGRILRRSYSIASTPGVDPFLSVTIKRLPNGEVSRHLLDHCKVGDLLSSLPPFGRFTLATHPGRQRNIFFIAAGSGMVPIFSLLKKALNEEPLSRITLLSQDRNEHTLLYWKSLEELERRYPSRFKWFPLLSRPLDGKMTSRRITNILLEELIHRQLALFPGNVSPGSGWQESPETMMGPGSLFYLCGPLPFMRMAQFTLRLMGFADSSIKKESFMVDFVPGPPFFPDYSPRNATIHFGHRTYAIQVVYPDSILTAALRAGIPLPYSCRGGRCSSCAARCLKGRVKMSINEVLSEKDLREGWVLTCVGYSETDVEIEV